MNADATANTARREKGATKKRERPNPPHKQQQQGPDSNDKQQKKNKTCETCDPTNLELSYIFNNTPQRKAPWPTEREREYTYSMT